MNCLPNLKKCKAECCKAIVIHIRNLPEKIQKRLLKEGCTMIGDYIKIPHKCKALSKDNKCTLHEMDAKPDACKRFDHEHTKGYWIPPNCIIKHTKQQATLKT